MPDYLGDAQRKVKQEDKEVENITGLKERTVGRQKRKIR